MFQCLPTGGFKWLTPNKINELDIHSLDPEEGKDLILKVDFEYPHKLHDLCNDYLLAAEKMKVTKDRLHLIAARFRRNIMYPLARSINWSQLWQTKKSMFYITLICNCICLLD